MHRAYQKTNRSLKVEVNVYHRYFIYNMFKNG